MSVCVCPAETLTVYGIPSASAVSESISKTFGLIVEPRLRIGPAPSFASPSIFGSPPGMSVAPVMSTASTTCGSSAKTRADVEVQLLELEAREVLAALERPPASPPDHAGHGTAACHDLDPLAQQHLRPPAAHPEDVEEALVVCVRDHQPDLVDVAEH